MDGEQPKTEKRHSKPDHPALSEPTLSLKAQQGQFQMPEQEILFGRYEVEVGSMSPHSVFVGSTRAGKTLLQKGFMKSILPGPSNHGGLSYRALIYDPKRELYPWLVAAGIPRTQIVVTHPFDMRGAAWDLAADFVEPAQIEELAQLIVPDLTEKPRDGTFFETATRIIIEDVLHGLRAVLGDRWTLLDLVESCATEARLKMVLEKTISGQETFRSYFDEEAPELEVSKDSRMSKSVFATLTNKVRPLKTLAALWHRAPNKFSLKTWHRGSGVLLIGADPQRDKTMQRLNRLLVKRASQLVRSRSEERPADLTWFFLDEVREAGKLEGLRELLTAGASKGARVVLGFQDIDGLIDVYGQHLAEEMVGQCANRIVLHLDNPRTQKWASSVFNEAEVWRSDSSQSDSTTYGRSPSYSISNSQSWRIGLRANALPVEFQMMPLANLDDGVYGWHAIPRRRGPFHIDGDDLADNLCLGNPVLTKEYTELERPVDHQSEVKWTPQDIERIQDAEIPVAPGHPDDRREAKINRRDIDLDDITIFN